MSVDGPRATALDPSPHQPFSCGRNILTFRIEDANNRNHGEVISPELTSFQIIGTIQ